MKPLKVTVLVINGIICAYSFTCFCWFIGNVHVATLARCRVKNAPLQNTTAENPPPLELKMLRLIAGPTVILLVFVE